MCVCVCVRVLFDKHFKWDLCYCRRRSHKIDLEVASMPPFF